VAQVVEPDRAPEVEALRVAVLADVLPDSGAVVGLAHLHHEVVGPPGVVAAPAPAAAGGGEHQALLRGRRDLLPPAEQLARGADERDVPHLAVLRRALVAEAHRDLGALAVEVHVAPVEAPEFALAQARVDRDQVHEAVGLRDLGAGLEARDLPELQEGPDLVPAQAPPLHVDAAGSVGVAEP